MPSSTSDNFPNLWTTEDSERNVVFANGRYVVSGYNYMIYTVQNGSLRDHIIVKCKQEGSSVYKGFAFLMSNGDLKLWRSHQNDATEPYVKVAYELFAWLFSPSCRSELRTNGESTRFFPSLGRQTIFFKSQCRRCNTSINRLYIWCSDHSFAAAEFRNEIENDERAMTYESQRARRIVTSAVSSAPIEPVTFSAVAPIRARSVSTMLLSENGTGLIR